jgi:ribonucleoside-diphosphate reductase alpha chain
MSTYTYQQVRDASIKYFGGDELAAEVFAGKYALRDLAGSIYELTPSDMHRRLAKEFARIEAKYPNPLTEKEIFCLFADLEHLDLPTRESMTLDELAAESRGLGSVIPQGSPMSAIGNDHQFQSLSNCFVIESPHDSYGGIMKADQEEAQIMKRRGGVGFDISTIRPKGIVTANAARTTDGIGVFMERFSNTCREVAQGGRRGALMLTIDVHHPEIRTFINIKRDLKKVTGANISIRLSDEFMQAVKDGGKAHLRFPVQKDAQHIVSEHVDAGELWHEIIEAAWASAEPGLLFWDTVLRRGPADAYASHGYLSTSTNPCGEITLSPYDSCRLLLVNLSKFVKNPFTADASFDFNKFNDTVKKAQRLMDDLIDLELEAVDRILDKIKSDPEPEEVKRPELNLWMKIRSAAINGRRTGLGITALGDALAYLNVRYGSDESVTKTDELYRGLALGAYRSTVEMARDRGAFPVFSHDIEKGHPFIEQVLNEDPALRADYEKYGRRNIALTTTAPAGSVSILTQTTSGCEPAFMLGYKRRRKINPSDFEAKVDFIDPLGDKWQEYMVYHHGFKKWMDVSGKTMDQAPESPYYGATSNEIDWVKKVDMQAAAQKWICHSISNTCVAADALVETDMGLLYMDEIANDAGCSDNEPAPVKDLRVKNHLGRNASVGLVSSQGEKQVYRVTTKSGNSVITTNDHKFILLNEISDIEAWTPLFDINVGDRIKLS